jgi:hypothetical protein
MIDVKEAVGCDCLTPNDARGAVMSNFPSPIDVREAVIPNCLIPTDVKGVAMFDCQKWEDSLIIALGNQP